LELLKAAIPTPDPWPAFSGHGSPKRSARSPQARTDLGPEGRLDSRPPGETSCQRACFIPAGERFSPDVDYRTPNHTHRDLKKSIACGEVSGNANETLCLYRREKEDKELNPSSPRYRKESVREGPGGLAGVLPPIQEVPRSIGDAPPLAASRFPLAASPLSSAASQFPRAANELSSAANEFP